MKNANMADRFVAFWRQLLLVQCRNNMMAIEQFVKIGSVPLCQSGSLGDVSLGCLQELNQILLLELPFCLGQGQDFFLMMLDCIVEQILRN